VKWPSLATRQNACKWRKLSCCTFIVRYYRTKICDKYILHGFIIARTWRQFCFGQTMKFLFTINYAAAVLPALLMLVAAGVPWAGQRSVSCGWRWFNRLAAAALATTLLALALELASAGA